MPKHVYIKHPDVYSYARELGLLDCLGAGAIRQPRQGGNHYILWFAFIAWLLQMLSCLKTMAYKSFNIIAVIRLGGSHAFCATHTPTPPETARHLYTRITPMGEGCCQTA